MCWTESCDDRDRFLLEMSGIEWNGRRERSHTISIEVKKYMYMHPPDENDDRPPERGDLKPFMSETCPCIDKESKIQRTNCDLYTTTSCVNEAAIFGVLI